MESINLAPQRPELEARALSQIIGLWLSDRYRRLPKSTVDGYAIKVKYFLEWWDSEGEEYDWLFSEDVLLEFNQHLDEFEKPDGEPLSYNTRKDALRRLRQALIWARRKNYFTTDFAALVPSPSGSAPLRTAATLDSLRRLIEATAESRFPTRDRAILAVLLGCGVRRAECASINAEWVRIDADNSGELRVEAKRVEQREIHQRVVAFDSATGKHIRAQLDALITQRGPLFPSYNSPRLTPIGIYRVVKALIRTAGLEDVIQGPHDLRRCFSTYYSRNRRGEGHGHLLSKQLGHSTYRMTTAYSLPDMEDVREVIISPFALLDKGDNLP